MTITSAVPSALTRSSSAGDLLAGGVVELAGGLVGQQQPRAVGERARDGDALHLAARELRRPVVGARRRGRRTSSSSRVRCAALGLRDARLRQRQLDVLAAVSIGSRKKRWNTKPMCRSRSRLRARVGERADVAAVEAAACPTIGASTQPSMCSSVDLPHPDGPRTAT